MMMMTSTNQKIERVLSSIEPTTTAESMVIERAIIECRARSQSMDNHPIMRTSTALLLGPLSLLLCLLLVLAGHTLGGYPDVEARGTGSQGQISNSLPDGGMTDTMTDMANGSDGALDGPLTCENVVVTDLDGPCRVPTPSSPPTLGGVTGRTDGRDALQVGSPKMMKKKEA